MIEARFCFGDLSLIFKVTMELNKSNLNQVELVCKIYDMVEGHLFSLKTILV